MPEAPRRRPEKHEVLRSFRGHLRARPPAVFAALDRRLDPGEGASGHYAADAAAFLVIVQGDWWYRGEYRAVPDEAGSNLEHVILNVAQRAPLLSRITARRVLSAAPGEFQTLLKDLRIELE
jgi:hypothetical protein